MDFSACADLWVAVPWGLASWCLHINKDIFAAIANPLCNQRQNFTLDYINIIRIISDTVEDTTDGVCKSKNYRKRKICECKNGENGIEEIGSMEIKFLTVSFIRLFISKVNSHCIFYELLLFLIFHYKSHFSLLRNIDRNMVQSIYFWGNKRIRLLIVCNDQRATFSVLVPKLSYTT